MFLRFLLSVARKKGNQMEYVSNFNQQNFDLDSDMVAVTCASLGLYVIY